MTDDLQKFLDELRDRLPIADVIGEKVKLSKRGREYTGLCPFHNEKTPSFTINETKGFYHCFGCGAHGDIVKFVMESEGLSFLETINKLAAKAGLQVPSLSKESQQQVLKRKTLYDIMEMATQFYEKNLRMPIGSSALTYFKEKRGLSDEVIAKFRLGFAPNNNGLKALLLSKGITEKEMSELGLLTVPDDKNRSSHDFFRNRVMIPIMDKQGHVIAFGGRIMDNSQPKYLNSPETPIFNKRRILYNLYHAREAAYNSKRLIICEGYMDVIALDSYNFSYAVAPLGTALTEEQVIEAWKVCSVPTLCFDGDSAGIRAAIRSIDRILPILRAGHSVNYIFLKEKKDPDELLRSLGPKRFEQYIQNSKPMVEILWHKCKMNKDLNTPEQKALIEKEVYEEVNKIKDVQTRNYYMQEMKKRIYFVIGKGSIYKNSSHKAQIVKSGNNFVKNPPLTDIVIRNIIAGMLLYPQLIKKYEEKLTAFELGKSRSAKMLMDIIEQAQDDPNISSEILFEKMELNFSKELSELWEINMFKQQKSTISDINKIIYNSLVEIQLKQIDEDIKECITSINNSPDVSQELYARYQHLIHERSSLLQEKE